MLTIHGKPVEVSEANRILIQDYIRLSSEGATVILTRTNEHGRVLNRLGYCIPLEEIPAVIVSLQGIYDKLPAAIAAEEAADRSAPRQARITDEEAQS